MAVEKTPLVERRPIDDAAIFAWRDQPERVGGEVARFVRSPDGC